MQAVTAGLLLFSFTPKNNVSYITLTEVSAAGIALRLCGLQSHAQLFCFRVRWGRLQQEWQENDGNHDIKERGYVSPGLQLQLSHLGNTLKETDS